jgi:glucan phosphoethanolaminetransferase (alkaline phosphatase superfamily)
MSPGKKIIIGLLSLLPIAFFVVYFIQFYSFFVEMVERRAYYETEQPDPREFLRSFMPFFILIIVKVLISIGLLIYFLINAINNKKIDTGERIVWIITFVLVGFIAFPLYWYMRIWRDDLNSNTI